MALFPGTDIVRMHKKIKLNNGILHPSIRLQSSCLEELYSYSAAAQSLCPLLSMYFFTQFPCVLTETLRYKGHFLNRRHSAHF